MAIKKCFGWIAITMTVLGISGNYLKAFKLVQKRICFGNAFKKIKPIKSW